MVPILTDPQLQRVHELTIILGLDRYRAVLNAGIDPAFIARMPHQLPTPSDQLLSDLRIMNEVERSDAGIVPLLVWMANAVALAGARPQGRELEAILKDAGGPIPGPVPADGGLPPGTEQAHLRAWARHDVPPPLHSRSVATRLTILLLIALTVLVAAWLILSRLLRLF